jgi:phosphohistidine phosphatase
MSRIYLLRHAKAVQALPGMKDFDRPLDAIGRDMALKLGAAMLASGLIPDRIIASPSGRTRETWASIAAQIPHAIDTEFDRMLFDGPEGSYLCAIKRGGNAKSVLIVGHNPMTEEAAVLLCANGTPDARRTLAQGFPTCGLAVIDLPGALADAAPGVGNLVLFVTGGEV